MKLGDAFKETIQMFQADAESQGIELETVIGTAIVTAICSLTDALNHASDAADTREFAIVKDLRELMASALRDNTTAKLLDDYQYLSKQLRAVAAGNGELGRNIHELRQGLEGQAARIEAIEDRLGEIATLLTQQHIAGESPV